MTLKNMFSSKKNRGQKNQGNRYVIILAYHQVNQYLSLLILTILNLKGSDSPPF